jgi:hypothetical protein
MQAFHDLVKFIAAVNHAVADKTLDLACPQNAVRNQLENNINLPNGLDNDCAR